MRYLSLSPLRFASLLYGALLGCCSIAMPPSQPEKAPSVGGIKGGFRAKRAMHLNLGAAFYTGKELPRGVPPPSSQNTGSERPTQNPEESSRVEGPAPPPAGNEDIIEVVLTFDDGPHADPLVYGENYTQTVVCTLKSNILQKEIKAVFFVQTQAAGRGGSPAGREIITMLARGGHVIGIHTGSKADHASHCARAAASPYDVNGNGVLDAADGANGLESDMICAKAAIRKLTGRESLYVRPTYGEWNRTVRSVYRRQNLKMILWDIDSGDNTGTPSVDDVNQNIRNGMKRCIAAGKKEVIILFHDINSATARNLEEYIGNICISARKLGRRVVLPTTTQRVMHILNARTDP